MKIQSRLLFLISSAALLFLMACNLGGAAQQAPTPTLMALPGSGSDTAGMPPDQPGVTPELAQTSPPAVLGGTVPICSLMTNDEAAAILGAPVTSAPREGGDTGSKFLNCEYFAAQQSLTLQAGSAQQAKELLMAAAFNMQILQANPDEQAVIDDTAANLASLTAQEVADRIFPMYNTHCFIVTPIEGVGEGGRWISCPKLTYTAVSGHRGAAEDELVYLDIVWLGSTLDEAAQQSMLVTAVNTALDRLPLGSRTVAGN